MFGVSISFITTVVFGIRFEVCLLLLFQSDWFVFYPK